MEINKADFISELPDELLLNIFSFLDETLIIQSSVFSKRWTHLWTLVPFPDHIKQARYNFKAQKIEIHKEKLVLEQVMNTTLSKLSIDVAKSIGLYLLHALLITLLGLLEFGVVHFFLTIVNMFHIYLSCWNCHSELKCFEEGSLKKLEERDSRLTLSANCHSTCSKLLMFPDGFHPKYAETSKLYGLYGMLTLLIVSGSIAVLRWNMEFTVQQTGSFSYLGFFSFLIHLGYLLYSWSSTLLCYFLHNRLISSFY